MTSRRATAVWARPWSPIYIGLHGQAVGLTTDTHPSDSLPSTQAIQTAAAAARQWSGWREIVPCDGLMARLHDACCSGARFNFYPQSITAPGKNSLHAGGGMHPPSPLCIRPWSCCDLRARPPSLRSATRGDLLCYTLWHPRICCGGSQGLETTAGARARETVSLLKSALKLKAHFHSVD